VASREQLQQEILFCLHRLEEKVDRTNDELDRMRLELTQVPQLIDARIEEQRRACHAEIEPVIVAYREGQAVKQFLDSSVGRITAIFGFILVTLNIIALTTPWL
jgi:hypothetical protein